MEENQMNQEANKMAGAKMYSAEEVQNIIKNVEMSIMKSVDREQMMLSLKLECLKIAERNNALSTIPELTDKAEELFKYIVNGK